LSRNLKSEGPEQDSDNDAAPLTRRAGKADIGDVLAARFRRAHHCGIWSRECLPLALGQSALSKAPEAEMDSVRRWPKSEGVTALQYCKSRTVILG
jgi:hypothetical protein